MRLFYIMASSLALNYALTLTDPPVASAVQPPAAVQSRETLVVSVPRGGSHRADATSPRKAGR